MLVSLQGFGSVWEQRAGRDPADPFRFSRHAAFYNTTGISVNGTTHYRWVLGGKVRFDGSSWFDSATPKNNIDSVFECDEPEQRPGWMQMCCKRRLQQPQAPDWFLFAITSKQLGWMRLRDRAVRSEDTYLFSYSVHNRQQELLLFMKPGAWIVGERGRLMVDSHPRHSWSARLISTIT